MCHGQIVGSALQTARSQRLPCEICDRTIKAGDEYVMHNVHVEDQGRVEKWKLCKRCAAWWQTIDWTSDDCPYDPRGLWRDEARDVGFRAMRQRLRDGLRALERFRRKPKAEPTP